VAQAIGGPHCQGHAQGSERKALEPYYARYSYDVKPMGWSSRVDQSGIRAMTMGNKLSSRTLEGPNIYRRARFVKVRRYITLHKVSSAIQRYNTFRFQGTLALLTIVSDLFDYSQNPSPHRVLIWLDFASVVFSHW
jgi:hypothetical protein